MAYKAPDIKSSQRGFELMQQYQQGNLSVEQLRSLEKEVTGLSLSGAHRFSGDMQSRQQQLIDWQEKVKLGEIGGKIKELEAGQERQVREQQALEQQQALRQEGVGMLETGYGRAAETLAPWMQTGQRATAQYEAMLGLGEGGPEAVRGILENLPGYQFRMEEGLRATERMQAARGRGLSGAAQTALMERGQGIASAEFGNYLGQLSNLMGMGFQASTSLATLGMQGAGAQANLVAGQAGHVAGLSQLGIGFQQQRQLMGEQQQYQAQQTQMQMAEARRQAEAMSEASMMGGLMSMGGSVIGGLVGGPAGAAMGSSIMGGLNSLFSPSTPNTESYVSPVNWNEASF